MRTKITKISITSDKISGRGGLPLFLRYVEETAAYSLISKVLMSLIVFSGKGLSLKSFLKQIIAFFIDGTDMSMLGFDKNKSDDGYAAILESKPEEMASSHQIKRFFKKLSIVNNLIFNKILHELFVWRLNLNNPTIIKLGIDTMVLDNDEAKKREGNEVTYKKVKGFQPLHICWKSFLIDVLFRKGSAHSNHGTDYVDRVTAIVELIRKRYSLNVPIMLYADSGFFDQKAFDLFDDLGIHYVCTGKMYDDVKEYVQELNVNNFSELTKGKTIWKYVEFGNKLKSWKKFRRGIFTKLHRDENGQYFMNFVKPDSIIYTNIGMNKNADEKLMNAGGAEYFEAKTIIQESHQRGADELIHRSIKELATKEQLPFKSFGMNRAYYFMLVITHFLFEAYKQDVTHDVIAPCVYPNTFRRKLIDFAAKITSKARNIILNVSKTIYESINIITIWERCNAAPRILLE